MSQNDPREDGFNYGAGWLKAGDNATYKAAEAIVSRLGDAMTYFTGLWWAGEMVLRNARLASSEDERKAAIAVIAAWAKANDERDSKGDPTPNYSFDEIATIGDNITDNAITAFDYEREVERYPGRPGMYDYPDGISGHNAALVQRTRLRRADIAYTGQPSPGASVRFPADHENVTGVVF